VKNFKVYKSSAGSGKTYTLVKEYLKLCLLGNTSFAYARILAITFTNKATYEMKSRIISALKGLSTEKEQQLCEQLSEETGLKMEEVKERAAILLLHLLHNYADFSISTIDRFSHKLIRTFTKDLGLSFNFKVELAERDLLKMVVDSLVDSVGRNKEISEILLNYLNYRIEEEKSWKIENDLLDFATGLLQEKAMPYLKALRSIGIKEVNHLLSIYRKKNETFLTRACDFGKEGVSLIQREQLSVEAFAYGKSGVASFYYGLANGDLDKVHSKRAKDAVENDKWYTSKTAPGIKNSIDTIKDDLAGIYKQAIDFIERDLPAYIGREEVLKNAHNLTLLNEIEKRFAALKKEEKVLNISDFNKIINEVVLHEPMPFIYERLGERYQHLMIDEFQDTSVLQFLNLLPLIEDSLARGNTNLIVGDAKQAIYRFRGGEVEQFSQMPRHPIEEEEGNEISKDRLLSLKGQYEELFLECNYRSLSEIVTFNNDFFEFVSGALTDNVSVKEIFYKHRQTYLDTKQGGMVALSFSEGRGEDLELQYLEKVLQSVRASISDGFRLADIAVLCRKRKQAATVADFLSEQGLEVISSEALLLERSEKVGFLINLAHYILNPVSDLAKKEILDFLIPHLQLKKSHEELFSEYLIHGETLALFFLRHGISFDTEDLLRKPLLELFEELIRLFGLNTHYDPYLQFFQDGVFDYVQTQGEGLQSFLEWWSTAGGSLSLDIPEDLDAITVVTVHKSKGLEFPVVIYPFANQSITHSSPRKKDFLWVPLEEEVKVPFALVEFSAQLKDSNFSTYYEEELRKKEVDLINDTYVAFTRASERLYIHSEKNNSGNLLSLPGLLRDFIARTEIDSEAESIFWGQASTKEQKEQQASDKRPELAYLSAAWGEKISIHRESTWEKAEPVSYGNLLHEILAEVHDRSEVKSVLDDFYCAGKLSQEECLLFENKVNSLLAKEPIASFFAAEHSSKREAAIFSPDKGLLRPDRVIQLPNCLVVLDYKTGEPSSEHEQQVQNYMKVVAETTTLPVRGYVLYTETENLQEVVL
jgi:ATP-dependent exoDNAse (exonuclease V) beta subunit